MTARRCDSRRASVERPPARRHVNSGRPPADVAGMEAINVSLPVQAMVMRDVRERVEQTTAAAQAGAAAPGDVILELSAAAQKLINLR